LPRDVSDLVATSSYMIDLERHSLALGAPARESHS
jgi:hypothetical protein